jgi:hypothetical protein
MTPAAFMSSYTADFGAQLVCERYSSGALALDTRIPTVAHIAEFYGNATAVAWLKVAIDSVDNIFGSTANDNQLRTDVAKLILAKYKTMNVCNILQFFTRYKLGEYVEAVKHVSGAEKILTALRMYAITLADDARRLYRERYMERMYAQRLEWANKAISYDEYIKSK